MKQTQFQRYSFRWRAINVFQEKESGEIIATDKQTAQKNLLQRGLKKIVVQRNWQFNITPSNQEIYQFFTQFATLLKASIPIKTALQIILQDCTNLELYDWISALIASLNQGYSLSYAINKENKYLTIQEISLIKVGEMTGKMPYLCEKIAYNQKQRLDLQRKIQKIMLYPSFVLGISLLLTLLLLIFIVPQFAKMYSDNQQTLPFFTLCLIWLSTFVRNQGIYLLVILISTIAFIKYFAPNQLRKLKQRIRYSLPLLKAFNHLIRQLHVSQNLSLMLNAGIPLNEALNCFLLPNQQIQDPILQKSIQQARVALLQGYAFSQVVNPQLFSRQAKNMLQVGEQAGTLPLMLENIAQSTQEKLDHQIALLSQLIEPLFMVVIGGLIGMIMLGMYLPIFNMGSFVS